MTPARLEFSVTGMDCPGCGLLVDDRVEDLPGVAASATDTLRGRTVVVLDGPVAPARIIEAVAALGYTAAPLGS
ncbi:heavy-metal-associated domain-containing protein [Streptomyces monticola]|uniref:Heavy-metal-associated domain-containing protein n=1 Tax=Streptomyces monticola TaxID=2666263 RepID=A0ABW2JDI2_9ACTN